MLSDCIAAKVLGSNQAQTQGCIIPRLMPTPRFEVPATYNLKLYYVYNKIYNVLIRHAKNCERAIV